MLFRGVFTTASDIYFPIALPSTPSITCIRGWQSSPKSQKWFMTAALTANAIGSVVGLMWHCYSSMGYYRSKPRPCPHCIHGGGLVTLEQIKIWTNKHRCYHNHHSTCIFCTFFRLSRGNMKNHARPVIPAPQFLDHKHKSESWAQQS